MKFKVGDRVITVREDEGFLKLYKAEMVGTIIYIDSRMRKIQVEFDTPLPGYNGIHYVDRYEIRHLTKLEQALK